MTLLIVEIDQMIKKFPIKKPYIFETPEGVDHVTKTLTDDNPSKKEEFKELNKGMKEGALRSEINSLKKVNSPDLHTPEQRGKILNIAKLEEDLDKIPSKRITKPVRRNYYDELLKTGRIPEADPKDKNRMSATDIWDKVFYPKMSPFEKGTFNADQGKKQHEQRNAKTPQEKLEIKVPHIDKSLITPDISVDRDQGSNNHYPGAISVGDNISKTPVEHVIRSKRIEPGLSENFVKDKLAESKIIKEVLGE